MFYTILIAYIAFVFLGSLGGAKTAGSTAEGYFLANRNLKTTALFFTILATNFSAFYFLGFAGEGYRVGYSYYVIMAFGTGFSCLSFYFIGTKVWKLGKEKGYITPSELIYDQTKSRFLRTLFSVVMLIFTFPYLALQIVGAGYILSTISGGEISYFLGAALLTLFTILYVWIGGMQSVAKTDLKQGIFSFVLMFLAIFLIGKSLGGITEANTLVFDQLPELFHREGANGAYTPKKWFSLLIFWVFCIPMFPQIFMRFYLAKDLTILKKSAWLYGAAPLVVSLLPVMIGVLGHLSFPDLKGREADQILPMMLSEHTPKWFATLVMTGALAAFMSTLDSQLLALSTIATRDFHLPFSNGTMDVKKQVKVGRVWVVILAMIGLAIAAEPFDTIFDMGKLAFAGLSILFPVTYAVLHWKNVNKAFLILSILVGEGLLIGSYYGLIPNFLFMGFDPIIPILVLCFGIVGLGKIWTLHNQAN